MVLNAADDPIRTILVRWWAICHAFESPDDYTRLVHEAPPGVADIIAVECLVGEVMNGGFDQYFSNSAGISIREAIRGLEAMELHPFAEIAKQALDLLGDKFCLDRQTRFERMYAATPGYFATDLFADLDMSFASWDDADDHRLACERYARQVLRHDG